MVYGIPIYIAIGLTFAIINILFQGIRIGRKLANGGYDEYPKNSSLSEFNGIGNVGFVIDVGFVLLLLSIMLMILWPALFIIIPLYITYVIQKRYNKKKENNEHRKIVRY